MAGSFLGKKYIVNIKYTVSSIRKIIWKLSYNLESKHKALPEFLKIHYKTNF